MNGRDRRDPPEDSAAPPRRIRPFGRLVLGALAVASLLSCGGEGAATGPGPGPGPDPDPPPEPATGSIQVSTATSGGEPDPDGYTITVDGGEERGIGVDDTVVVEGLEDGDRTVELGGMADNCGLLEDDDRRSVAVAADDTATTAFAVHCVTPLEGRIVFASRRDGDDEIFVMDTTGANLLALTNDPGSDLRPDVSPDGTRIAFVSDRDGDDEIFVMWADGTDPEPLTENQEFDSSPTWSPDGTRIAFAGVRDGNRDIWVTAADGSGSPERLTDDAAVDAAPAWSPDGARIAFHTERGGDFDVYLMDADGSNETPLVDADGLHIDPSWSPDGDDIVFVRRGSAGEDTELVVTSSQPSPMQIFSLVTNNDAPDGDPAWSRDGSRIAFRTNREGADVNHEIHLIDPDGLNETQLTAHPSVDQDPAWSP